MTLVIGRKAPLAFSTMTDFAKIDAFDRAILKVVQRDASLTHEAIGERVSLSASSVRRRLSALKKAGYITGEVALLAGAERGVTLIVSLTLSEETPEAYKALDALLESEEPVKQSYHVAGADDYILIVHEASVHAYEQWSRRVLMSNPHIRRFETRVALSRPKFDTTIALD